MVAFAGKVGSGGVDGRYHVVVDVVAIEGVGWPWT